MRILLVGASFEDGQAVSASLGRGFEVLVAGGMDEGARLATDDAFDCIVLDLEQPGSHGAQTVERWFERGPTAPVVAVAGDEDLDVGRDALAHGAQDCLSRDALGGPALARAVEFAVARGRCTRALHKSEASWRSLAGRVPDQLLILDDGGRVLFANRGLPDIHFPEGQILWESVTAPDLRKAVDEVVRTGLSVAFEASLGIGDDARMLSGHAGPLDPHVSGGSVVVTLRDVTAARERSARAAEGERMDSMGRLAGGIAHDFNNLLTAITSYAEFALEDGSSEESRAADIRGVLRTAERGAALARQLLVFAAAAPGELEVVDLAQLLEQLRGLLARTVGPGIRLVSNIPARGYPVRADAGQIERVLLNLALNARDAMQDGGTLTLALSLAEPKDLQGLPAGPYLRLDVRDTGPGIAADQLPHVFEPAFTAESGRRVGFALASSYGVLRQAGGDLRVRSTPGKGSTFSLVLPLSDAPAAADGRGERREDGEALAAAGNRGRVLVAEDEPIVRDLVCRVLGRAGFELTVAVDGEEAAAVLDSGASIDLILTDLVMPKMGGAALAAHAQRTHPGVPVLFMSGYAADQGPPPDLGSGPILAKPFNSAELLRRVRGLLLAASLNTEAP